MRVRKFAELLLILPLLGICTQAASEAQTADSSKVSAVEKAAPVPVELPALRGVLEVPVQVEPQPDVLQRTNGEDWHRVSSVLSGSMCVACLLELEGKLRELPGIAFAKINRESSPTPPPGPSVSVEATAASSVAQNSAAGETKAGSALSVSNAKGAAAKSADSPTEADAHKATAIVIYDNSAVTLDRLQQFIKHEKYKLVDMKDLPFSKSLSQ